MAEATVDTGGGNANVSAITRGSIVGLGLTEGMTIYAIIKSTEVILGKDEGRRRRHRKWPIKGAGFVAAGP